MLLTNVAGNMNKRTILAGKIAGKVNKRTILAGKIAGKVAGNILGYNAQYSPWLNPVEKFFRFL